MRFLAADDWIRDTRHGLRALWRAPAFTLVATLTLGLGVGAVTVIYSVVYNVVVSPLPDRDADRLVNVMVEDARGELPPEGGSHESASCGLKTAHAIAWLPASAGRPPEAQDAARLPTAATTLVR